MANCLFRGAKGTHQIFNIMLFLNFFWLFLDDFQCKPLYIMRLNQKCLIFPKNCLFFVFYRKWVAVILIQVRVPDPKRRIVTKFVIFFFNRIFGGFLLWIRSVNVFPCINGQNSYSNYLKYIYIGKVQGEHKLAFRVYNV